MADADPADAPRWGLGDAVLATLSGLVLSVLAGSLVLAAAGVDTYDELAIWQLLAVQVALWAGLAGVPWLASRNKGSGSLRRDYGFWFRGVDVPFGLVVGVASQLALSAAAPPLYRLLGVDDDEIGATAEKLADRADDPFAVVCLFLLVVVGAAVVEELCYRGLWQGAFTKRWGPAAGIVGSALVFGLVHLQWYDLPLLVSFGLVLAVLRARAGRLGPAVWAHLAFNLTALVALL